MRERGKEEWERILVLDYPPNYGVAGSGISWLSWHVVYCLALPWWLPCLVLWNMGRVEGAGVEKGAGVKRR
jgi:hypothetical protein